MPDSAYAETVRCLGVGIGEQGVDPLERLSGSSALRSFASTAVSRLLAICTEPGLGASVIMTELSARCSASGFPVKRCDLSRLDPSRASEVLVRLARSASRSDGGTIFLFDRIPPSDESSVRRQARALKKMWEAGVPVCFSLNPEASQLLDSLPEALVVSSRDLLMGDVVDAEVGSAAGEICELTHGIAPLVECVEGLDRSDLIAGKLPKAYYDAVGRQALISMRRSIPDEELRARLCMALLGRGSLEELGIALGGIAAEALAHLSRVAPFYRIDLSANRFHTPLRNAVIDSCGVASLLGATSALFPDVVASAIRALLERGSFSRAVLLLGLPGAAGASQHVVRFGAPLLDVGGASAVSLALDSLSSGEADGADVLSLAVSAIAGETLDKEAPSDVLGLARGRGQQDAALFVDARCALRGGKELASALGADVSELGRRLLAHREAVSLLLAGRPSAAMRLLVANPCESKIVTASSALLCLDHEAARLLLCEGGEGDRARLDEAVALLSSASMSGLGGYVRCIQVLRAVMGSEGDVRNVDAALVRAERDGDSLVQSLALAAGCAIDLRGGSYARAGVRATLATAVSRQAGLGYIARVSRLLGEVARFHLGEEPGEGAGSSRCDELGKVERLVHAVMRADDRPSLFDDEMGARIPTDTLWLLLLLCDGMASFSGALERALPTSWRYAVESAKRDRGDRIAEGGGAARRSSDSRGTERGGEAPIRVTLLGDFGLAVHGIRILDGYISHRSAQSVLTYLLLQRRATARRQQIVSQIWPECDYVVGSNRVYQATSTIRAAIAEVDQALDPFVLGRSTRSIALDMSMVSCDVYDFRASAREAIDGSDDVEVVRLARRVEQLYAGDLYVPAADCTGFVAAARAELRALYVDAMVAGAEAALRLERRRTASRFAANALSVDDMREDALIALVGALRAEGRDAEADQRCRRYVRKLSQTTGRSPSWRLLQVMGERRARG